MKTTKQIVGVVLAAMFTGAGLYACEREGPLERLGEEVDEAVDSAKNGGEPVATKVDDAVDELRE